jgi:hypothetical protein
MFTNFTASAAAQHQHTLRADAEHARLVRAVRVTNHTAPQPAASPRPRRVLAWRRRVRTA